MHLRNSLLGSLLTAALAGFAHLWLLGTFWDYWSVRNPLLPLLISKSHVAPYYQWVLQPTDFLTSVLVSLPAAALILFLRPPRPWLYTLVAAVPSGLHAYWPMYLSDAPGSSWLVMAQFGILPVAVAMLQLVVRRFAPNNSFKPRPLRGSA